jgi:hypothetical protein
VTLTPALAYGFLAGAAAAYCISNLLLARGSAGGLAGAVRSRSYLAGTAGQAAGFLLAFAARRELPLLVVQSGVTVSLALTALARATLARRRLQATEATGVLAVIGGLALAAAAALPGPAADPGTAPLLLVLAVLAACTALLAAPLLDRCGIPDRVRPAVLGAASGLAFGASAIGARVAVGDLLGQQVTPAGLVGLLRTAPGLLAVTLVVAGTVIGQLLLTTALASGALTGPVAAMHVLETAAPALVGVTLLGDRIAPGHAWPATAGVLLAVLGSARLATCDAPQVRGDHARTTPP